MLLFILVATVVLCAVAYRYYGRALERWTGIDAANPTPAHTEADGMDYVPARPSVLFGHHFSSIAGAGPIVGPIIAASFFGWGPTWVWILLGAIFVGGVHDFGSTVMSLRARGRSITETCRNLVGERTGKLFMLFAIVALIYVIIVFLDLTASGFVTKPAVATSSGWFVLTALGFGLVLRRKAMSFGTAAAVFILLTYAGLAIGSALPAEGIGKTAWLVAVLGYCLLAATLPVNWLMQPRDFLSATFLYAIMGIGLLGLLFHSGKMQLPAFTSFQPENFGALMPFLFITVACGACSGFHSMVASGTTSKQLDSEAHAKPVAYGGMLVEGVLAAFALACIGVLGQTTGSPVDTFAKGAAVFFGTLGIPQGMGETFAMLAVSTFLLTTLDTCTRLARFLIEELTGLERTLRNRTLITAGVLITCGLFAFQSYGGVPAWKAIWPLFGATNQLLGALALVTFVVYQRSRRKFFGFAIIPAVVMVLMPMLALALMAFSGATLEAIAAQNPTQALLLRIMAGALFALGFGVIAMSVRTLLTPQAVVETA